MQTLPALASERPYLRLTRDERESLVAEAVAALDQRIAEPPTMEPGELYEFADWDRRGSTTFRYVLPSGRYFGAEIPTAACTPAVRAKLWRLIDEVKEADSR